jgi:hypothetical protein
MTLELSLRRFSLLASFAQLGGDEPPPPKIHWVGEKEAREQKPEPGQKRGGERPQKKKDTQGYRDVASVTMGEVNEAYKHYYKQLLTSPAPGWLAPNYFCMVHLAPGYTPRPPAVFGRVKTCYPADGYIQNIQELEIALPNKRGAPDLIHLRGRDVLQTPEKPVQSFCVRVRVLASQADLADFAGQEGLFFQQGFAPEFQSNYIDLLEVNEQDHKSVPWLYVIGSRWFASVPVSMQAEVREKLTKLIHWKKLVFNYHPEHLPREVRTLNRELGFKAGFTKQFLIEPETPGQVVEIVSRRFEKLFEKPMGK